MQTSACCLLFLLARGAPLDASLGAGASLARRRLARAADAHRPDTRVCGSSAAPATGRCRRSSRRSRCLPPATKAGPAGLRDRQGTGGAGLRARRTAARRCNRAAAGVAPAAHADRRRLHHGPQAAERGHRAQEGGGARPARQPRAAAAGAGLHRDETRRLGAARARTPRQGRARRRDPVATGSPVSTTMRPVRLGDSPAAGRWRRARRRLPARTTIWVSATKRSTRRTRRSRSTAKRSGSIASTTRRARRGRRSTSGILLRTRGELDEAEALFREALTYDQHFAPGLLPARHGPGAARTAWTTR